MRVVTSHTANPADTDTDTAANADSSTNNADSSAGRGRRRRRRQRPRPPTGARDTWRLWRHCMCRHGWYPLVVAPVVTVACLLDLLSSTDCQFVRVHVGFRPTNDAWSASDVVDVGFWAHGVVNDDEEEEESRTNDMDWTMEELSSDGNGKNASSNDLTATATAARTAEEDSGRRRRDRDAGRKHNNHIIPGCREYSSEFNDYFIRGDRAWSAARIMAFSSGVAGITAFVTIWLMTICPLPASLIWPGVLLPSVLVGLLTGGAKFFLLDAGICKRRLWRRDNDDDLAAAGEVAESCVLRRGALFGVGSVCFFFVATGLVFYHVPDKRRLDPDYGAKRGDDAGRGRSDDGDVGGGGGGGEPRRSRGGGDGGDRGDDDDGDLERPPPRVADDRRRVDHRRRDRRRDDGRRRNRRSSSNDHRLSSSSSMRRIPESGHDRDPHPHHHDGDCDAAPTDYQYDAEERDGAPYGTSSNSGGGDPPTNDDVESVMEKISIYLKESGSQFNMSDRSSGSHGHNHSKDKDKDTGKDKDKETTNTSINTITKLAKWSSMTMPLKLTTIDKPEVVKRWQSNKQSSSSAPPSVSGTEDSVHTSSSCVPDVVENSGSARVRTRSGKSRPKLPPSSSSSKPHVVHHHPHSHHPHHHSLNTTVHHTNTARSFGSDGPEMATDKDDKRRRSHGSHHSAPPLRKTSSSGSYRAY